MISHCLLSTIIIIIVINNDNGNLYSAFGNSKRFTITLKCGTHEKKKKQCSKRKINDNSTSFFFKLKKQACYQKHNEMHAHTQAGRHAHKQTNRQTDRLTHTYTHTHTHTHTHDDRIMGGGGGGEPRKENKSYY